HRLPAGAQELLVPLRRPGLGVNMNTLPLYVGGRFENGADPSQEVVNPATGAPLARAARATRAETDAAIQAARAAFDSGAWAGATAMKRGQVLLEVARRLRAATAELARLETENMGKPIVEAEIDVADAAACFEYYGGLATKITGDVNPVPDEALSLTLKEPVGVCGQIIPWNYPLLMAAWKIAPALAAGCTVVLKPAEATPMTALELARILDGISDLPKGVVNVVTGDGPVVGALLARATRMGPLVTAAHRERVLSYVEQGRREGARLVLGGGKPDGALARGAYLEPTIFDRVDPAMKIAQEEIFGPVVAVIPFEGEPEAVEIANAT